METVNPAAVAGCAGYFLIVIGVAMMVYGIMGWGRHD